MFDRQPPNQEKFEGVTRKPSTKAAARTVGRLGGGATVVREFLAADLIDVMQVVQVPLLLGRGVCV